MTEKSEEVLDISDYSWMVRPCEMYKAEYQDCKSIKARFHQHFIHGKPADCNQWIDDFTNCISWRKNQDLSSLEKVIKSEQKRKLKRLTDMMQNDIWELRSEPVSPEEWNKPLPDFMLKRQQSSYLNAKQNLENLDNSQSTDSKWQCTIL